MNFTTFANVTTQQPCKLSFAQAEVVVYTNRAPDKETPNEDSALVLSDGDSLVLAIADGAGGYANAHESSAMAIDALVAALETHHTEQPMRSPILDAFDSAHQQITERMSGAATTLTVVEMQTPTMRTYHAGDSGVLVTGNKGRLKFQTIVHSPTGYGVESGLLDADDALSHEDRHYVSNLLGKEPMSVEIGSPFSLARRDTVVLGSDGLFDNLYVEEIIEFVRKGRIERACVEVVEAAAANMVAENPERTSKPDDLTVILVRRRS